MNELDLIATVYVSTILAVMSIVLAYIWHHAYVYERLLNHLQERRGRR